MTTLYRQELRGPDDVVVARRRTYRLAASLGLRPRLRTRITVLANELSRRARGRTPATYTVRLDGDDLVLELETSKDIELDKVLEGAASIVDRMEHTPRRLAFVKKLPAAIPPHEELRAAMMEDSDPEDLVEELERQNREMLRVLADVDLAEAARRRSDERLEAALSAAGIGTWEIAEDLTFSARAQEMLDVPAHVSLEEFAERCDEGGLEAGRALDLLRVAGEPLLCDVRIGARWFRLEGAREVVDQVRRTVGTVWDDTERHNREKEMAFRLDFEKHLVGIVSHDLKSPLAAISMGASMLEGADDFVVQRIRSSARRAQRLVYDLLDFTRARLSGGIPVHAEAGTDVVAVVRETVEQMRLAHPERAFELRVERPVTAFADEARVAQVVTNLLANALQHGAEDRPIEVVCDATDEAALVSVRNEGEPIPEDRLPSLFEPLEHTEDADEKGSLGLGLFIVRELVRAHGGSVRVHSDAEATEFTIAIPRSEHDGEEE